MLNVFLSLLCRSYVVLFFRFFCRSFYWLFIFLSLSTSSKSQKRNPHYWHSFDSILFLVSLMNEWFYFSFPVFPYYLSLFFFTLFLPDSSFFFLSKSILFFHYYNTNDTGRKEIGSERVNKFLINLGMWMIHESESKGMKERKADGKYQFFLACKRAFFPRSLLNLFSSIICIFSIPLF